MNKKSQENFDSLWTELLEATSKRSHPWRNIQLSTVSDEQAFSRTVILRSINKDKRTVECHTDIRSPKIQHIQHNSKIHWLAYNPDSKIQISCFARAKIHNQNALAKSRWSEIHSNTQLTYGNKHAPGSQLSSYKELVTNVVIEDKFDVEFAFRNFAVIESELHTIEYLSLNPTGNVRVRFIYKNGRWQSEWVAP